MCFQHSGHYVKGIVVAIWTIVQTSFHIVFVLGAYYICQFKPSHYLLIIFYITYFYNYDKCGTFLLGAESYFLSKNETRLIDLKSNSTQDEDDIYTIVQTIVENAAFPRQTSPYLRTQIYLFVYIIYDGCWLLSSFLLFAGISFQVKKCLSVIFYGPWLVITAVSVVLDVIAAVHFGLDMLQIYNYTSWLKFIGVSNYQQFTKFNEYRSSAYVPHISSIAMALFLCRFLVFWVLNIVNFFTITSNFAFAYRGCSIDRNSNQVGRRPQKRTNNTMNSSESRIRNWQMFYGNVDTNSSRSSSSIKSDQEFNSPPGVNLRMSATAKKNSLDSPKPVAGNSTTRYSLDSNIEYLSSANSSPKITTSYVKYPDVTEGMDIKARKGSTDSIRRDVPWSYLRFNEKPPSVLGNYKEDSNTNSRDKLVTIAAERPGTAAKMGHGADKKMSETAIRKRVRRSSGRRCL